MRDTIRQILVGVAVAATIIVNVLANALPINGQGTGEVSDRFQVFFVPAGYVFSIWGLIYLGLIAYAVYQAQPAQKTNPFLRAIGLPFIVSCLANIGWIFLWHYNQFGLSVVAMLVLLSMLIITYLQLGIGRQSASDGRRWFVNRPISIYLGWITVATIANITAYLDSIGWNGGGVAPELWAAVMMVVAGFITVAVLFTRRDGLFAAVIVWAFIGIAVRFSDTAIVAMAAWGTATIILLLGVASILRILPKLPAPTHY